MPSPFRRLPPALHRPAIVVVLILGSASAGLALSTAKRQDSLLGLLAREPRGPVWWAIMAVAAVIVVRLTRARAVRWLVPIACGAAFLTVAELANERSGMSAVSRLPQVSPHQPLTLVATGTRETMTIRGLTRLAKESEAMKWQQTASRALTCDPPEDVTCQAVYVDSAIRGWERYRSLLRTVAAPLAATSKCLRGVDAHDAAIARHEQNTQAIFRALLEGEFERAGELQHGPFAIGYEALQTEGIADMDHCLPAELR